MAGAADDVTGEFMTVVENRKRPAKDRPRLSEEIEARLAPVEERCAECYAELEVLSHRVERAARRIADPVDDTEFDDGDSLVAKIDDLKAKAKEGGDGHRHGGGRKNGTP